MNKMAGCASSAPSSSCTMDILRNGFIRNLNTLKIDMTKASVLLHEHLGYSSNNNKKIVIFNIARTTIIAKQLFTRFNISYTNSLKCNALVISHGHVS